MTGTSETKSIINNLVLKAVLDDTFFKNRLIDASVDVVTGETDLRSAATELTEAWLSDWCTFSDNAWFDIVKAGLINNSCPDNVSHDGRLKFWQFRYYEEQLARTLQTVLRELTQRTAPNLSDFEVKTTIDGCLVQDVRGHAVLHCTRITAGMVAFKTPESKNLEEALSYLLKNTYTSHKQLLLDVVFAFRASPKAWDNFQKFPVARSSFEMTDRVYLCAPFSAKDYIKANGARYEPTEKAWFCHRPIPETLQKWAPTFDLCPDPLPETTWYDNVRSTISDSQWQEIKRTVAQENGNRCNCCGGRGKEWPVECHEIWEFNDALGVQKLVGLKALCPPCHEVVHIGLANMNSRADQAINHMVRVTGLPRDRCVDMENEALNTAERRSRRNWKIDISFLSDFKPRDTNARNKEINAHQSASTIFGR